MFTRRIFSLTTTLLLGLGILSSPAAVLAKTDTNTERGGNPSPVHNFLGKQAVVGVGDVTAKSGTSLTIAKGGKTYQVLTDGQTQFRRKFWGKSSFEEISVGDQVNVIGKWSNSAKTEIKATLIRDLSIQKRSGVILGLVKSLSGSDFVLATQSRGDINVTPDSSTKFTDRRGKSISQSDLSVGHRVRAKGMLDLTNHTMTEVVGVNDYSLPVK